MSKIAINSNTNGKVRHEKLNNRTHLVTQMRPIVGDIVMNGGLYPDEEVTNSYMQLEQLPAPNGHPKVGGRHISAFHPLAVNTHNVGAFIRNPVKTGKEVYNELWIDEMIANQSDDGREILKRLNEGTPIGVSTGLELEKTAVNEEGLDYSWVGRNYKFDHVAILLNEAAAGGDQTTTVNEEDVEVAAFEENAFSFTSMKDQLAGMISKSDGPDDYSYISDVFMESDSGGYVVFERKENYQKQMFTVDNGVVSLLDAPVSVIREVMYKDVAEQAAINDATPDKDPEMDKEAQMNIESAVAFLEGKGFAITNAADAQNEEMKFFLENKEAIKSLIANQASVESDLRAKVLAANSQLTEDEVNSMSMGLLQKLAPKVADRSLASGFVGNQSVTIENEGEVPDYTPNYGDDK